MKANAQKRALATHRRRLKRRGIARVEVRVHKDDVSLVRAIAEALADPERRAPTRTMLREHLGGPASLGLKDWLVSAPLEGIELPRDRDFGRDVDL